jgi:putative membrane protein
MRRLTIAAVAVSLTFLAVAATATTAVAHRSPSPLEAVFVAPVGVATLDDATIVAIFDAANTADIETGQLASERGQSKEVREFGAMLVRDHQHVRRLGRDLASKLGVTPTPPKVDQSAKDHAATMARLRGLTGVAFDRAFLQHEVAFHKAVIDAIRSTLLPAIKNEELKALVVKVAPAFEAHMLAAQNLEKRLVARESE